MLLLPASGSPRRYAGLSLGTALITGALFANVLLGAGPASARPDPRLDDHSDRYSCRHETVAPEGAVMSELGTARGLPTVFSPIISDLVYQLSVGDFDGYIAGLSGATPIEVGGEPTTLSTRYSLVPAGQVAWQYAFERLSELGYEVYYHEYTRSGYNLRNVVARLPGTVTPDQIYVMGGHIDSTSEDPENLAPGAEDNGSGSAAILAAAEALVGQSFESTIELVLFSGEEQGLWGSRAYVQDALDAGRDIRSAVTCDMIAYHDTDYGVLIEGETPWIPLMQIMADAVDTYTTLTREFSYFSFGSDHVPFQDENIPAILCIDLDWAEYPYYHRTTDTYEQIDSAFGVQIARAAMATVIHQAGPLGAVDVAGSPTVPAFRLFPNPTSTILSIGLSPGDAAGGVGIYDVGGRRVRTLVSPASGAGRPTSLVWDLRDDTGNRVTAGAYWVHGGDIRQKIVVLR